MSDLHKLPAGAGEVNITFARVVVAIVPITQVPFSWHGIAPDGDLGSGDLIGEIQHPAQCAQLFGDVEHSIITPADAVGRVVGHAEYIIHVRNNRIAVGEGTTVGVGVPSVNRDVERPVAQAWNTAPGTGRRGHQSNTGADVVARGFGKRVVAKFVGYSVAADSDVGVAVGRYQVQLPRDLLNGHLHLKGDVREIRRGHNHIGLAVEGDFGEGLLA